MRHEFIKVKSRLFVVFPMFSVIACFISWLHITKVALSNKRGECLSALLSSLRNEVCFTAEGLLHRCVTSWTNGVFHPASETGAGVGLIGLEEEI